MVFEHYLLMPNLPIRLGMKFFLHLILLPILHCAEGVPLFTVTSQHLLEPFRCLRSRGAYTAENLFWTNIIYIIKF